MSYYNRNLTKSAWNFVDTVNEDDKKYEMIKNRASEFNNILFNETQKSKIVENTSLK